MEWSNDLILLFLELYQGEPVIWDPQHRNHKDKKKVADAWERLSVKLNTPIKELKIKKEILMGTFRRHLKKKQDSIRSGAEPGDIYEPIWFAYPLMESFLLPVYTTRQTINTETKCMYVDVKIDENEENEKRCDVPWENKTIQEFRSKTSGGKKRSRDASPAPQGSVSAASAARQTEPAFEYVCSSMHDEYDTFGKLIASKLKKIRNNNTREVVMNDIHNLIFHACVRDQQEQQGRIEQQGQRQQQQQAAAAQPTQIILKDAEEVKIKDEDDDDI